ncbi:MAG: DUF4469 domain-containing protein [Tannerellaceae bacterium]|nr:DUF4469 domain-containing protein [Tannerellaceae bacterium]
MDNKKPEFYVPPPELEMDNPPPPKQLPAPPHIAFVDTVTDVLTGRADVLIPGREVCIKGSLIKVTPDDEPGLGVFLVPYAKDEEPDIAFLVELVENVRHMIKFLVPEDLPKGKYLLRIVTRYSGTNFLKYQRFIDYKNIVSCKAD